MAVSIKSGRYSPEDIDHAEVEGTITDITSASSFSVDGLPVDASKASYPNDAYLAKGVRVEVEGAVVNGILVATTVEIKTDKDEEDEGFEVEGEITSLDTVNSTFVVRGVTISYAGAVTFVAGTAAELKPNAEVEIHGPLVQGAQQ